MILLTIAGSLSLAPRATAQETNVAAEPEVISATNNPADESNAPPAAAVNETAMNPEGGSGGQLHPIVMFGQDVELKVGDSAEAVVVIGGSAKIHGKVREAVVTIGGSSEVDGEVGEAVVAVMGNVHLQPGARVHEDAVAVMGVLTVDPKAKVSGDTVAVGGRLKIADGANVRGEKVNVGFPIPFFNLGWLGKWLKYCVFELRPLAPQVGFVWAIAGVFFLFYLFIAVCFPQPVQACVDHLTRRLATTFLMGLLTKILVPVVVIVLAITGIGLIVVPFLWAALFIGAAVGKVAVLEWLGLKLGRHFGKGFERPLVAFLVGTVLLTLFYLVPVLGLLSYTIFGVWGLGCAVTAVFSRSRREMPDKPAVAQPAYGIPPTMAAVAPMPSTGGQGISADVVSAPPVPGAAASPGTSDSLPPGVPPPQMAAGAPPSAAAAFPPALACPRAGFWERMGAAFLDLVVVAVIAGIVRGPLGLLMGFLNFPPAVFIVALAYFAGLWAWKGTTIGGIVLKLQVVRHDGGPMTILVAFVRGLAAALSAVVLFLGFFWIGWDREKQGWHDKIAGTIVVRLPRSVPLVCL
ncbi:MAG TPA: RDD family protein [Candidatus Acidoferrum sp.]|nr:RDD family protein [Candidatus Acidoferrum sp.]